MRYEKCSFLLDALIELYERVNADEGERSHLSVIGAEAFSYDKEYGTTSNRRSSDLSTTTEGLPP